MIKPARIYIPTEDFEDIFNTMRETLSSGNLTNNKLCRKFEHDFSKYLGNKYSIATSSGTSALEVAIKSLELEGGEVLIQSNTNFATPIAAINSGLDVKYIDIDQNYLSPSIEIIKKNVSVNTKLIIMVHIGGFVNPEIEQIYDYCKANKIYLIEDAAHSHGVTLNGKKVGTFSDISCFSFFPTKVITSCEGGMISTNNYEIDKKARILIDQGKKSLERNLHVSHGNSWRMSELHATIGIKQLKRLEEFIGNRTKIANYYNDEIYKRKLCRYLTPVQPYKGLRVNYYKYVVMLNTEVNRSLLKDSLEKMQVYLSGGVYDIPCHKQPIFMTNQLNLPNTDQFCNNHICLPIYNDMEISEAKEVINALDIVLSNMHGGGKIGW